MPRASKATADKPVDKPVGKPVGKPVDKVAPAQARKAEKAAPVKKAKKTVAPAGPAAEVKKAAPAKRSAAASAPGKPTGKPPADKFLAEQQALLREERQAYLRQAESLKADADQLAEEMEPGDVQFDEESGEGATMNVERERDLTLSAQARAAVEDIDRALAKIDAGTYGVCERCGQPIARARLRALPYAAQCVACKSGGLLRR